MLEGLLGLEKQLVKWKETLGPGILGSGPDSALNLLWDLSNVIFSFRVSVFHG